MPLSSSVIGRKVGLIMNDYEVNFEHEKVSVSSLATWIIEACDEIVRLKPTELIQRAALLLTPNSTYQTLTAGSLVSMADGADLTVEPLQLLDIGRNMGADGTAAGRATQKTKRSTLDTLLPDWPEHAAEETIRWVMIDPDEPLSFQVCFKAPSAAHYLEVLLSRKPVHGLLPTATSFAQNDIDAGLSVELETVIIDYVLYRVLDTIGKSAVNQERAVYHLQKFGQALGVEIQKDKAYPRRTRIRDEESKP